MSQSKIHYDASKLGINGEGEKFKSLSKIAFDIFQMVPFLALIIVGF